MVLYTSNCKRREMLRIKRGRKRGEGEEREKERGEDMKMPSLIKVRHKQPTNQALHNKQRRLKGRVFTRQNNRLAAVHVVLRCSQGQVTAELEATSLVLYLRLTNCLQS
jgi:hypothetical protein